MCQTRDAARWIRPARATLPGASNMSTGIALHFAFSEKGHHQMADTVWTVIENAIAPAAPPPHAT
jgi:hypothetical protein